MRRSTVQRQPAYPAQAPMERTRFGIEAKIMSELLHVKERSAPFRKASRLNARFDPTSNNGRTVNDASNWGKQGAPLVEHRIANYSPPTDYSLVAGSGIIPPKSFTPIRCPPHHSPSPPAAGRCRPARECSGRRWMRSRSSLAFLFPPRHTGPYLNDKG